MIKRFLLIYFLFRHLVKQKEYLVSFKYKWDLNSFIIGIQVVNIEYFYIIFRVIVHLKVRL